MEAVLIDPQRQKLPNIQRAMHDLKSVGLPISFCAELLQNPGQRAAIAAIAAEADRERKQTQETMASVRSARAERNRSGAIQVWSQGRQLILYKLNDTVAGVNHKAYRQALATLTPAQRQSIRRSGAFYTPR